MSTITPYQKLLWSSSFVLVFLWSAWQPADYFTWFLEVTPAMIAAAALIATAKTFPFTPLAYTLILIHCWILMVGGHYTYAEVPLFNTIRDLLNQDRNNYDKLGHFAQGFIPAIICREIIIRKKWIDPNNSSNRKIIAFFTVCFCLAFSAFYELIEWLVAESTGESAEAFLGTQGYVWDTQSDMAFALLGAIIAIITLSSLHDKQIRQI